jgi:lipopolysaccharide transport system permease protein
MCVNLERPKVVIDATKSAFLIDWNEYVEKRDLFWFLALRDVKIRFKQAALGAAWAILKPLALMIVFVVFLGHLMRFPTDGVPYPLFYYSGLVFWNFFATGLNLSSDSLLGNNFLVTKVYCPPLYIPAAPIASQFVDLGMGFITLIALMLYFNIWPSFRFVIIPLLVLIMLAATLGMGLLFAPLVAKYRDFQNLMAVLIQMWFFMSPIIYPSTFVPDRWKFLYSLNPMVGAIEGFRWAVVGQGAFPSVAVGVGLLSAISLLAIGFFSFMKNSDNVADFI